MVEIRSRGVLEVELLSLWLFVASAITRDSICNNISVGERTSDKMKEKGERSFGTFEDNPKIGPDCTVEPVIYSHLYLYAKHCVHLSNGLSLRVRHQSPSKYEVSPHLGPASRRNSLSQIWPQRTSKEKVINCFNPFLTHALCGRCSSNCSWPLDQPW